MGNSLTGTEESIKESKLLQIKELRKIIHEKFEIKAVLQRLFVKGKLLKMILPGERT